MQEIKNIKNCLFWTLATLCFGVVGFIIYIVFGNRLKFKAKKALKNKQKTTKNYIRYCSWYKLNKRNNLTNLNNNQNNLIKYLKNNFNNNLWHNNITKYYVNGTTFSKDLIADLKNAKKLILIEFYIFFSDSTGECVAEILKQKAKEGVKVKLIYDAVGSRKTSKKFWNNLKKCGVEVYSFFPPMFKLDFLNFKLNYRNHRKIVVVDGKISYIGGINLRDDHMGKDKNLSPWFDTAVKICGSASYAITDIFLNDFNFVSGQNINLKYADMYFPKINNSYGSGLQILDSGPDKELPIILNAYLKIIKQVKEFLYIQTPYFIVENNTLEQIIQAKLKGVDVKVIIPKKPDKKIVYSATLKCIRKLIEAGIDVYLFNGFIHSKTVICEDVLSVGSCNFDYRSFYLNFEITSFNYNLKEINGYKDIFTTALKACQKLTPKQHKGLLYKYKLPYIIYKLIYKAL